MKMIKKALVAASVAVMSAPVFAEDLLSTASTEIGALKTGIVAFGVVVGIAIAIVSIGLVKRVINKA
ncbi:hypothetical protein [Neisseria sp.]